jgi:hypothetical protein
MLSIVRVFRLNHLHRVLFTLGIVSLIISMAVDSYIWYVIYRPVIQVGIIGDIPWSTLILGIVLTSLGYWKKTLNKK